jgi:hypothetical protein
VSVDPYARCRDCGSRNIEGIADAHAIGRIDRHGNVVDVTRFEVALSPASRDSLLCAACGSWRVRPPEGLRPRTPALTGKEQADG